MSELFMLIPSLTLLVPAIPLVAALGIVLHQLTHREINDINERPTARMAVGAGLASLLLMLALDGVALYRGAPGLLNFGNWFASGDLVLPLSLTLDRLSLSIGTLVALIAWLTLRFSVNYMHREAGFHRFFLALSLFTGAMLLIVLAGNALMSFVGWELAGVSSYLLIGYAQERPTATGNAVRAFVTNRIGDAGFIIGIASATLWLGTLQWPEINARAAQLETLPVGLMTLGFVVAALAKSAQVPFSPWIARALEGPTPSSAIFYGALMVHAGVYLLLRMEPLLTQAPAVMVLIALLGALTALYGYFAGLTQTDVKSALIFSTTTQVGLMFLECGLGWFDLAAWHLGLHASWRAWQFLAAPSYMHLVGNAAPAAPAWLARRARLYTAALQRFWLEPLGDWLATRPTQGLARDVDAFDQRVLSRLVGVPEQAGNLLAEARAADPENVVRGRGAAGRLLEWVAERFEGIERHLLFHGKEGWVGPLLARIAHYLRAVESLLEQPRYLVVLIMATLAVVM